MSGKDEVIQWCCEADLGCDHPVSLTQDGYNAASAVGAVLCAEHAADQPAPHEHAHVTPVAWEWWWRSDLYGWERCARGIAQRETATRLRCACGSVVDV